MDGRTNYASSGDLSIAYRTFGEGEIDLVIVPGFVSHVELLWEHPTIGPLHAPPFVLRPGDHLRQARAGALRPARPARRRSKSRWTTFTRCSMRPAARGRRCSGSPRAGRCRCCSPPRYPERVSSLVLYGTYARMLQAPDYPAGVPDRALDRWGEMRAPRLGRTGRRRGLGAERCAGDPRVRTMVGAAAAAGDEPGRRDRADRPLPRDRRARGAAGDRGADAGPAPRATTGSSRSARAATWPSTSPAPATSSCPATDHLPSVGDQDAMIDEIEEFLRRQPPRAASPNGRWRRSSSPTSSARPRRRRELGDRRWRDLLERHDAIVRRELAVHRGREVKTMGDGFLATFDGPARAIRCAAADPRRARRRSASRSGPASTPARSS